MSASSGPVENILPAILMSKNIDLYNIIILRSIDVITSLYVLLILVLFLTLHKIILEVLMLLYFSLILVEKRIVDTICIDVN